MMARRFVRVSGSGAYSRTTGLAKELYISTEASVLAAVGECDSLGQDEFLRKYGFKRARRIFLRHKGRDYDPRAIFAVASLHEGRTPEALTARELALLIPQLGTGIEETLFGLGFEIVEGPKVETGSGRRNLSDEELERKLDDIFLGL